MANLEHTASTVTLEKLCQGAIALQGAAEPHRDIVNVKVGGTPEHRAAAEHATRLTDAAEQLAGQAATIPAGTRDEVIFKACAILALSHSAMGPAAELAASLPRDVLLHLGAQPA